MIMRIVLSGLLTLTLSVLASPSFAQNANPLPPGDGREIVANGSRLSYFDTVCDFGFFTEVVEETPEFLQQLAKVAQTCAEWDGTDPVRLLTRTGYTTPS